MISENVAVFDPTRMSIEQLKRCIYLCNMHIKHCYEENNPHVAYLNNWRSDRVRFIRALEKKLAA